MKHIIYSLLALLSLTALTSCNDYETYGDKKEKERKAIKQFIADRGITVITEQKFHEQGNVTDTARNEYVYLDNSGVYMQIYHKGCGTPLQDGENSDLLIRFVEISLLDSTALYNDTSPYDVDVMNIRRQGTTYTASFTKGLMRSTYNTESVPSGWLVPFKYINLGGEDSEDANIAKVKLIVPHSQGHAVASNYVYPYYYEISMQRKYRFR